MDNTVDNEPEEKEPEEILEEISVLEEIDQLKAEEKIEGSNSLEETIPPSFEIAGFWPRSIAFIIDVIIISIPFLIVGVVFTDFAFSLGPYGIFLGYSVFILYWGYFNSESRQGQTVGKRVLKIVVVDKQSNYLTLKDSFLRAFVLGLILILGEWTYSSLRFPIIGVIISLLGSIGAFILFYGLVFNRTTRQGAHDLLAKSYVIKTPPSVDAEPSAMPKKHKQFMIGISIVIALLYIGSALFATPAFGLLEEDEWDELVALQADLQGKEGVFSAGVQRLNRSSMGSGTTLHDLNITLWVSTRCSNNQSYCEELIDETARYALQEFDGAENLDGMQISIMNRYDLGIPEVKAVVGTQLSMEDWQERLAE